MKKSSIVFSLLVTIVAAFLPMTANAQQPGLINWQNDGDINAFLYSDVDSITYSKVDLNGRMHPNVVVQEIWKQGNAHRIPIATIDSVTFKGPKPVYNDEVFHIRDFHYPYVTDVTDLTVTFDTSIPADSLPVIGQIIVSDRAYVEPFMHGFAGRVVNKTTLKERIRFECEEVNLEDVFKELFLFGKVVNNSEDSIPNRMPNRSVDIINEQGYTTIDFGKKTFDILRNGSSHLSLDITPEITIDYTVCLRLFEKDVFKFEANNTFVCDLGFYWDKSFEIDKTIFPFDALSFQIFPGFSAYVNLGAYLKASGSADLGLYRRVTLKSKIGYDSQGTGPDPDNKGLCIDFQDPVWEDPVGYANFDASISAGAAFQVGACIGKEDWAGINLTLRVGPRLSGKLGFSTNQATVYADHYNDSISFEPVTATLSGGVQVFTYEKEWTIGELPIARWFPALAQRTRYLFPKFSATTLPGLQAAANGYSLTALTATINRNLIFPVTPGIKITKGNQEYTYLSDSKYRNENKWVGTNLQMELWNKASNTSRYPEGTYTTAPVFKIFGLTVPATPTSTVTIPDSMLVSSSSVVLKRGESKTIDFTGGWGDYSLTNSVTSVCAAYITGQLIKITGLNNGETTLTLTDVRSHQDAEIKVYVLDDQIPSFVIDKNNLTLDPVDLNSSNNTSTETFKVTGVNLTGNLTISPESNNYFRVTPTTITPSQAAAGQDVIVTYEPEQHGNHTATFTISGGGVQENQCVNVTGMSCAIYGPTEPVEVGNVEVGKSGTATFTLTGANLTEAITVVEPHQESHGNEFTISPTSFANPNGSNTVRVYYTPSGAHSSSAQFTFKSGIATVTVTIKGKGIGTITAVPDSIDFGTAAKNGTKQLKFKVNGSNLKGNLTLAPTGQYYSVSPTSITPTNGTVDNKEVTVTFSPKAIGTYQGYITISGGGAKSTSVSLTGKCGEITGPTEVQIDSVPVGTTSPPKSFKLTGVNLTDPISLVTMQETIQGEFNITSSLPLDPAGGTVKVTFTPTRAGNSSAELTFKSGDIYFTVIVSGTGIGTITPTSTSLDFGTVAKNGTKQMKFKVNGSNLKGNLTLTASGQYYSVSPTSITPTNGTVNNKEVTVTFSPKAIGTYEGAITISGGGAKSTSVSLTGKCGEITGLAEVQIDSVPVGTTSPPKSIKLTGVNLTDPISLVTMQETIQGEFNVTSSLPLNPAGGTVKVTYTPTRAGNSSAELTFKSGDVYFTVIVSGTGVNYINTNPESWNFGTVVKNYTSSAKTFTVNTSASGSLQMTKTGDTGMFSVNKTSVSNGDTFSVTYKPTSPGSHSMTITLYDGTNSKKITVSGTCEAGYITVTPSSLNFGTNLVPGKSYSKAFTVTTNVPGVLSYSSNTGNGEFTVPTIKVGSNTVTFKSDYAGSFSGVINIQDTKSGATAQVNMNADVSSTITANSLDFSTQDYNTTKYLNIKCEAANSALDLTKSGDTGYFIGIIPSTISKEDARNGVSIPISCKKTITNQNSASLKIVISGGGATSSKTVYVNYSTNPITLNSPRPDDEPDED